MNSYILNLLSKRDNTLYKIWSEEIDKNENMSKSENEYNEQTNKRLFQFIVNSVIHYDTETDNELRQFYLNLLEKDWTLNYLTVAIQSFRRCVLKLILEVEEDREKVIDIYEDIDRWFDPIIQQLVNDCTATWSSKLQHQKETVKELTAPMIPVFHKICVLPLIGNISDDRAEVIKRNLLEGIVHYRCQYVLMDITGVPVVDTYVANYLMQATEAARMLGSECMIVGVRPEIAQTLVSLGIKLNVKTFSNLYKGIEFVLNEVE